MPNIVLTRIDNRLVHGQVGVTWTKTFNVNLLLVANDKASTDPLAQSLMSSVSKSSGVGIRFFSLEHTANVIHKAADRQMIFIVVETPADARKLVELGVPIKSINIGNMHFSKGKHQISKKVYVDDTDLQDFEYLKSQGIELYIQDVPGDSKEVI